MVRHKAQRFVQREEAIVAAAEADADRDDEGAFADRDDEGAFAEVFIHK